MYNINHIRLSVRHPICLRFILLRLFRLNLVVLTKCPGFLNILTLLES